MLVGGCTDWFLMCTPYCTLDRWRFWLRDAACSFCLLHFSFAASCISASNLHLTFLTDEHQLSRSETSWLMADSCLCMLFLQLVFIMLSWSSTIVLSFLELAEEDCFWHAHYWILPSLWHGQPSAAAPEARWTLCWASWLSWGLLHLTRGLAIWCQEWSAGSVGKTTPVAWSASDREPRSLHHTGGWER